MENMNFKEMVGEEWYDFFNKNGLAIEMENIVKNLNVLYENNTIYPKKSQIFRIFKEISPNSVRVVFLGQDCYPGVYRGVPSACGRAFATENGYINPSLRNIMRELKDDVGMGNKTTFDPSLQLWVDQGVFLLNTALTVEAGSPGSHIELWKPFTSNFIRRFSEEYDIIWVLLGNSAQKWESIINRGTIIKAAHPSPLAGGRFFGSKIFSKINEKNKIKWN